VRTGSTSRRKTSRHGAILALCLALLLLAAFDGHCAQDNFTFNYFRYRDENDTINAAFAFRLDKQVFEKTKLKLSYLHSDTRYWKVPLWEPAVRHYSRGDQYSLQVEQTGSSWSDTFSPTTP